MIVFIIIIIISTIPTYAQNRPLVDFLITLKPQNHLQLRTIQSGDFIELQTGLNVMSSGLSTSISSLSSIQGDCNADFSDIQSNAFYQSIIYVTAHCLMSHTIREGAFFPFNLLRRYDIWQTIQRLLAKQVITIHTETVIEAFFTKRTITDNDRRRLLKLERVLGSGRLDQKDEFVTRRDVRLLVGLLTLIIPGFDSSGIRVLDSSSDYYITRGEWAFILSRLYKSGPHSIVVNLEESPPNVHSSRTHLSAPSSSQQIQTPKEIKQTPEYVMVASAQSLGFTTMTPTLLDKPIPPRDFLALLVLANHKANPHIPAYSDNPRYRRNKTLALLDQAKNLGLTRMRSGASIDVIYQSSGFVSPSIAAELIGGKVSNEPGVITYRQALMSILPKYNIVPSHQLITRKTPRQRLHTLLR